MERKNRHQKDQDHTRNPLQGFWEFGLQIVRYRLDLEAEVQRRRTSVDPRADSKAKLYEGIIKFGERRNLW